MRFPFPAQAAAAVLAIAIAIAASPGTSGAAGEFDIVLRTPRLISFETTFAAPGGAVRVEATLRYDERGRIAGSGTSTFDGAGVDLAVRGALRSRDGAHFYAIVLRGVSAAGEKVLIKLAGDLGSTTALASYRGPAGRVAGAPAEMSIRLDEQPAVLLVLEPDVDCSGRIGGAGVIFGGFELDGMSIGDLAGKLDVRRGRLKWKLAAGRRKIIFRGTLAAHGYENAGEPVDSQGQLLDSINLVGWSPLTVLLAPVGLRYHALHHYLPSLPYHSLGFVHRQLLAELPPDAPYRQTVREGVLAPLQKLWQKQPA